MKMKKLEKLNESKFKAFKGEKISDLAKLVGGGVINTQYSGSGGRHGADVFNSATHNGSWTDSSGQAVDYAETGTLGQPGSFIITLTNNGLQETDNVYTTA